MNAKPLSQEILSQEHCGMTDYFALLKQPRQPWLNEDLLRQAFLVLSTETHPDRFHQSTLEKQLEAKLRSSELNTAYTCLREAKSRLLHLIQLEKGSSPREIQEIPDETTGLFMQVGNLCREADQFLSHQKKPTSPLLQIQWFQRAEELREALNQLQESLKSWRDRLFEEMKNLNQVWEKESHNALKPAHFKRLPLDKLEQLYRLLSYETRWSSQIQERIFQLVL